MIQIDENTPRNNYCELINLRTIRYVGSNATQDKKRMEETIHKLRKNSNEQTLQQKRIVPKDTTEIVHAGSALEESLPQLIQDIQTNDPDKVLTSMVKLRKLVSSSNNYYALKIYHYNGIQRIIKLLDESYNTRIKFEAAWAISNLATESGEVFEELIKLGALEIFISLLESPIVKLKDQAILGLSNIIGDSIAMRDTAIPKGLLTKIISIMNTEKNTAIVRNGLRLISNICRWRSDEFIDSIKLLVPVLCDFIKSGSTDQLSIQNCCWAMYYATQFGDPIAEDMIHEGVVANILEMLDSISLNLVRPTLRIVGNMLNCSDSIVQILVEKNCVNHLKKLIVSTDVAIKLDVCWALGNLLASTLNIKNFIVNSTLFDDLIKISKDDDFSLCKEALLSLLSAVRYCSFDQIVVMLEKGICDALCRKFKSFNLNIQIGIITALYSLITRVNIINPHMIFLFRDKLSEYGLVNELEKLQLYCNSNSCHECSEIIKIISYS